MQHSTAWRVISCKNTFLLPHMLLPVLTDFSVFFCSLLLPAGHIPKTSFSLLFSRSGVLRKKPASGLIFLPFFHLLLFFTIYSFRIVRVAVFFQQPSRRSVLLPRAQASSVYLQYAGFLQNKTGSHYSHRSCQTKKGTNLSQDARHPGRRWQESNLPFG